jgi:hypothetical protein
VGSTWRATVSVSRTGSVSRADRLPSDDLLPGSFHARMSRVPKNLWIPRRLSSSQDLAA